MKKLIALAAAVGFLVVAGCSTDKNKGGVADEYYSGNRNQPFSQGIPPSYTPSVCEPYLD